MELFGFEIPLDKSETDESEQVTVSARNAEARTAPDAPMHLLLRFETANGPRTVIASSVPRQVAVDIRDVMTKCGQHAEFIDRIEPLSVSDRVMINQLH
jgi:hypothetical protein